MVKPSSPCANYPAGQLIRKGVPSNSASSISNKSYFCPGFKGSRYNDPYFELRSGTLFQPESMLIWRHRTGCHYGAIKWHLNWDTKFKLYLTSWHNADARTSDHCLPGLSAQQCSHSSPRRSEWQEDFRVLVKIPCSESRDVSSLLSSSRWWKQLRRYLLRNVLREHRRRPSSSHQWLIISKSWH